MSSSPSWSVAIVVAAGILIGFASKRRASTPAGQMPGLLDPWEGPKVPQRVWRLEVGAIVHLDPARRYAARIELSGLEALASSERVSDELKKYAQWDALDVHSDAADVSPNFPRPKPLENALGRFFAIGDPSNAQTFPRPEPIAELWSRPRPTH